MSDNFFLDRQTDRQTDIVVHREVTLRGDYVEMTLFKKESS